jgi:hypothetical protein
MPSPTLTTSASKESSPARRVGRVEVGVLLIRNSARMKYFLGVSCPNKFLHTFSAPPATSLVLW